MPLNYVTVTCDLFDGSGFPNATRGSAYFTPSQVLTDPPDRQIVGLNTIRAQFMGNTVPSVTLLATDNTNITGWAWNVSFSQQPNVLGPDPFTFEVPAGPAAFTATSATPAVFTWTPTAALTTLPNGTGVILSGGSLPTGFTAATVYYVVNASGATFELSAQVGGAPLASMSTGSGNLTVVSMFLSAMTPVSSPQSFSPFLPSLTAPTTMISSGTLATNTVTEANATSGNLTMTLPSAVGNGSLLVVEKSDSTYNTVSVSGSIRGVGSSSISLSYQNESMMFQSYQNSWWPIASHKPFSALDKRYERVYSVTAYGADPTGVADSTAAFNACINALLAGNNTPGSTTRVPLGKMYMPAGTYTVSSDILIQSVQGFILEGAGPELSIINATGTGFTTAVINVDGSYAGVYTGFTIKGDGTEQVTNAFNLTFTTSAHRSTTGNKIADIRVRNLNFVNGISLAGVLTRQVDGTFLQNIVVAGRQTTGSWSNSGNWQAGFVFGNGNFGNIYDQVLVRCEAANVYYSYYCNVSGFALFGGQPANNFSDFYIVPGSQITVESIQSQNSAQFLIAPSNFSAIPVSFKDVKVSTSFFAGAGNAVITLAGGTWEFTNFNATNLIASAAYVNGAISIQGSSAARPCVATFTNLALFNDRVSAFTPLTNARIVSTNYLNYNPQTGNYTSATGDLGSQFAGGIWTNITGVTVPQVTFISATGNTSYTVPAGAQTVYVALGAAAGGGGSGAFAAAGAAGGGGGGGGGGYSTATFQASQLTGTVTVSNGSGGGGGAAVTAAGAGNPGGTGGSTLFGSYLWAHGGSLGAAGNATNAAAAGGGAGGTGMFAGSAGGGSVTGAAAGNAGAGNVTCGGGAGGGVIAGPTAENGGGSGTTFLGGNANGGTAGIVGGATPTAGPVAAQGDTAGGGGGGAGAISGTAQNGASATASSCAGGGGGGGCSGGTASGAGGAGSNGFALIIAYFQ